MKKGGVGGANTKTGLVFEKRVDVATLLKKIPGYVVDSSLHRAGQDILYKGKLVARCFKGYSFYKFLDEQGVDWPSLISKKLLPDNALIVVVRDTLFIIEVKYQQVQGSVDEKLQTCDFKRKQYQKLVHGLGLKVEYVYVLSDWFRKDVYKDTLDYINSVNCHYLFGALPLSWLGLPTGK